jgi:ABC-type multidrug transport system fused ATPase/permease subunit
MRLARSLWGFLDRRQRWTLAGLTFVAVLMACSTVTGMAAVLPFFTVLADPGALAGHPGLRFLSTHLPRGGHALVEVLGVGFALLLGLTSVINLAGSIAMQRFALQVGNRLHAALLEEYLHRDYRFHVENGSARLTARVIFEVARVIAGVLQQGLVLVTSLATSAAILAAMVLLDPVVALLALGGLGAGYGAVYAAARVRLAANGRAESRAHEERMRIVNECLGGIREVILTGTQDEFVRRFASSCHAISRSSLNTQVIAQIPRSVLEGASAAVLAAVALYLAQRPQGAAPWVAQLGFLGLAVYRLLPALQLLFAAVVRICAELPTLEVLLNDLARPRCAVRPPPVVPPWPDRPPEIRCSAVTFRHAPGAAPVLAGLDLHVPAGTVVGIVGANGSGKSTLLDLLCGLLLPQSGSVMIDGIALDEHNRAAWQSRIAYVPQEIFLLDATVAENVAFGVPHGQIDHARVQAALEAAQLAQVIAALPRGPGERLGERGALLSGGERQRLGIARALYRAAPMLILDEATSALDAAAEREVIEALIAHRPRSATVVLVAHRLASLRCCDVIYEMADGRLLRWTSSGELSEQRPPHDIVAVGAAS